MKLCSAESWRIEPGEVLRWRLTPRGSAVRSAVPVSENEYFHLTSVSEGQSGWIALTLDFPSALGADLLADVAATIIARHDVLRGHYVRTGTRYERLLHTDFDVKEEDRQPAAAGGDGTAFSESMAALISSACDPFEALPHVIAAVRRPDSTTVVYGFDHCYVDARSLALLASEICALVARRTLDPAESGLLALGGVAEHEASVTPDDPRLAGWERFLGESDWEVPEFPLDLGLPAGQSAPMRTLVATVASAESARAFSSVVHTLGARTYPALLTCAAVAIARIGGPDEVATVLPTGTTAGPGVVCWSVGNAPMRISASGDLPAAMARNTARLQAALPLAEIGLTPVYGAYGHRLQRRRTDIFMMSYVDYTRLPTPDAGVRVQQISSHRPTDTAQWWFWRDGDGIHVRVRYPHTARAVEVLGAVVESMNRMVADVVAER